MRPPPIQEASFTTRKFLLGIESAHHVEKDRDLCGCFRVVEAHVSRHRDGRDGKRTEETPKCQILLVFNRGRDRIEDASASG